MAMWTLNRLEAFTPGVAGQQQWSIDFAQAFTNNEMSVLGVSAATPIRVI
jgi:hypothetical protein